MLKKSLFLVVLIVLSMGFSVPEKVMKKADKVIAKFYGTAEFSKEAMAVSELENSLTPSHFGANNFFKISVNDSLLGYGYIGNAPSKTATFDYLVLFDENFIISKSKVLIYREEYGGEIGSKRWLRQFDGESTASSELKYNEEIIPIAGATISVRSMTQAMNDLLVSLRKLQELNVL